jgi:hypothetical protein
MTASAGLKFMRRMTNTHGKFTERMKIFYENLKLSQLYRKYKITEISGYNMFDEWTETDYHT